MVAVMILSLGVSAQVASAHTLGRIVTTINTHYPYQYSNVKVTSNCYDTAGRKMSGIRVYHTFYYKTTTPTVSYYTNSYGYCTFNRYISSATAGYKVVIKSKATHGVTRYGSNWFIPRKR